jgi:uncharacterized membrane protein YiaA
MSEIDKKRAAQAMGSIEKLYAAGLAHGVYTRTFGISVALWTGSLITTFASGSGWFVLLLVAGFLVGAVWQRRERERMGAWVNEVKSWSELALVVSVAVAITGLSVGALVAAKNGLVWAPWVAGAMSAGTVYGLMEWAYHDVWAARDRDTL